ncbi:MAG TPA: thioredoxin domain-containing protein [Acidobacteriaceae bacterium]
MIFRISLRTLPTLLALAASLGASAQSTGSNAVPAAPAPQSIATPAAPPAAPAFPQQDPRNFTAATPTRDTVEAFLRQTWGYDADRVWQVQAIQKTSAPGVSKVTVMVAQKSNPQQTGSLVFWTTPDGNNLIANDVLPFGAHPFDTRRQLLQAAATGPARGAKTKTMLLVEFADFECPHCKEVQPTIAKLLLDFPQARFVYENFPLVSIHSEAYKASAYSVCVAKLNGNEAFFRFSDALFADQAQLTPEASTQALKDAATKAGADPSKVAACSTSPEAKTAVDGSVKLAQDLDINETPYLFVNGRGIPIGGLAYEQLKQIVAYQFSQDK